MTQARIDLLEQEVASLRAQNKRLRLIMTVRQRLDARQIRELEQAVQNLLHVTVPIFGQPFDNTGLWGGSFIWDNMRHLKDDPHASEKETASARRAPAADHDL